VDTLPKVLAYLIVSLPAYALPDLAKVVPADQLKAAYAKHFVETVAEKRAVYGIPESEVAS
jgi:hypothetical protein